MSNDKSIIERVECYIWWCILIITDRKSSFNFLKIHVVICFYNWYRFYLIYWLRRALRSKVSIWLTEIRISVHSITYSSLMCWLRIILFLLKYVTAKLQYSPDPPKGLWGQRKGKNPRSKDHLSVHPLWTSSQTKERNERRRTSQRADIHTYTHAQLIYPDHPSSFSRKRTS